MVSRRVGAVCLMMAMVIGFLAGGFTAVMGSPGSTTDEGAPPAPAGQRTVVLETFTATWCGPCTYETQALHQLEGEYTRDQLVIAEWHTRDNWDPVDGSKDERYNYYGVTGIPTVVFDGQDKVVGASSKQGAYNAYKSNIDNHLAIPGEITITQTATINGASLSVDATVDPEQKSGTFTARILLLENTETVDSNHNVDWVVRLTVQKQSVTLTAGQTAQVSGTASINPSWDDQKLYVVTFLQDDSTKVVLNGNFVQATAGGGGNDTVEPTISNVQHTPATPTDQDTVTVSATVTDNVGVSSVTLNYDDGNGTQTAPMTPSGSTYSADIGPFPGGTSVTYYVEASDAAGNTAQSQQGSFTVKSTPQKDTEAPVVQGVSHTPATPMDQDTVTVSATVTDNVGVSSVTLNYDDGNGTQTAPMTPSGSTYSADIGPFPGGTSVTYYVEASDAAGNTAQSQQGSFTVKSTEPSKTPDVTVESNGISIEPASPKVGDQVTITATIKNVGTGDATSVEVKFYVDGNAIDTKTIATLAAGGSSTQSISWTPTKDGSHTVKVEATVAGDADTSNDAGSTSVTVQAKDGGGGGGGGGTSSTSGTDMLMWLLPLILIAVAIVLVAYFIGRRKKQTPQPFYQQDPFGGQQPPQW